MIERHIEVPLPVPWDDQVFATERIGAINFMVGPNGSGKSQFAGMLFSVLNRILKSGRFLGTDRLAEMSGSNSFHRYWGDNFASGFAKDQFSRLRSAGEAGSGIDTIVLLEERMDLRIKLEATLSHLFDREISLEWDSGRLVPMVARRDGGASYRLDREECHGIKELLVMLTHLYDEKNHFLVIDEPELNLHPQYQAFFMQEVRRVAGDPRKDDSKKIVFLVTHSPFILDLRTSDDFRSIISFDLDFSVPKQINNLELQFPSLTSFIRRLNVHHKQFFFSDNPVFVEGIHDAWLVEAMMEARGVSVAGAGSCIIDAGGVEEVNQYLKLCQGLGKTAHFLYDLDSLFSGNLRTCIRDDESIQDILALAGLGTDFVEYCGQLERKLTRLIDEMLYSCLPSSLADFGSHLGSLRGERGDWDKNQLRKARTAVMKAIDLHREDLVEVVSSNKLKDIEGRWSKILTILKEKNIYVLPGGTIERYLPLYRGDKYVLKEGAKRNAIEAEIEQMAETECEEDLAARYGELYETIRKLPSKAKVDVDPVLINHLKRYIFELQMTVRNNPEWQIDQIRKRMNAVQSSWKEVFEIQKFEPSTKDEFSATIKIFEMLDQQERVVYVNESTNAVYGNFQIEFVQTVNGNVP